MAQIEAKFDRLYASHVLYRTTGVTLADLQPVRPQQAQIFSYGRLDRLERAFASVDILAARYGSKTVRLATSLKSIPGAPADDITDLDMPIWGEVS